MTELTQDLSLAQARSLIDSYAFDLGRDDAEQLLVYWLDLYHASWIRLATIEALYLGRYKAISIEHILNVWLRLGNPNPHFTYEFERLICRKLPKHLSNLTDITADTQTSSLTRDFPYIVEEKIEHKSERPRLETTGLTLTSSISQQADQPLSATIADDPPNLSKAFGNPDSYSEPHVSLMSAIGFSPQSSWSEFTTDSKTIHQFIPLPDMSSFFLKLKTLGESKQQEL